MPTISRKALEAMPGFDAAFHLGEKPAGETPAAQEVAAAALAGLSEKEFQARVVAYAESRGWLVYHTHNSRRSNPGFPDLCMVRYGAMPGLGKVIFAELKTETGKETSAQREWRKALELVGGTVEAHLWRPSNWAEIERILK